MNHLYFCRKVGEALFFFLYRQQMFRLSTLLTGDWVGKNETKTKTKKGLDCGIQLCDYVCLML